MFITYYWPPAGGASTNRIVKFAKHLTAYGWEPVIVTVEKGDFPTVDEKLVQDIPKHLSVYKSKNVSFFPIIKALTRNKKISVPKSFTDQTNQSVKMKLMRWIKSNTIPDTRIFWYPFALRHAQKIVEKEQIDIIFSSSPPQTNHLIAAALSTKYAIPWVADLRDPWNDMYWNQKDSNRLQLLDKIDKKIEKNTLVKASRVTSIGPTIAKLLEKKVKKEVDVIYNGFDDQYISTAVEESGRDQKKPFTILYAGSISFQQRPVGLFQTLSKLVKQESPSFSFQVTFMGEYGVFLQNMINEYDLGKFVTIVASVSQRDVFKHLAMADLLLVLGIKDCNYGVIPSKLFEYLLSGKPILGYGLEKDADSILQDTRHGKNFQFDDPNGNSAEFIKEVYEGRFQVPDNQESIQKFNRKVLTGQLAALFDQVVEHKAVSASKNNVKSI